MKRSKRIYILLGVLVVACGATYGVSRYEEHKEQIRNSDEIILELSGDSVKSLSWEYGTETLGFHWDENWIYDEDEAFPVDQEKVAELLEQFEALGAAFAIEDVEDYGQYGLDDPVCTIHLATQEESFEILLGDFSKMDQQRYVSIGNGNVYLVQNDPWDYFDRTLSDMIHHDATPSFNKVTGVQFTGAENYQIAYEEESKSTYCADDVYFTERDGRSKPLDTIRVKSYLRRISSLSLTDYVTYNVTEEELKAYGLDAPELTVMVDYIVEDEAGEEVSSTFVLYVGLDQNEKEAAEQAAENGEDSDETVTAYVRVGESQIVYQISGATFDNLMEVSYDSLRHLEVFTADFADIYQIDISLEDVNYSIVAEESEDGRKWYYQEEELQISGFQSALQKLDAESFTEEQPADKEEIKLTVYLNNENYPTVQIVLYRYDGSNCLAVLDGEPVSLVSRSDVVDLMEAVYAIVLN